MSDSGIRIRVSDELREAFIERCREQDLTAAQVIRSFMRSYIGEAPSSDDKVIENSEN